MIEPISWLVIAPEIALLTSACIIVLVDLWVRSSARNITYWLTQISLLVLAVWQALHASALSQPNMAQSLYGFGGMVVMDSFGSWLKCAATLAVAGTLTYAHAYTHERDMLKRGGEWFTLALFALLGVYIMISANHFLLLYLGVELISLCSFALVALRRDCPLSAEAGMKYFVLGALASGFLLYGISMVYGATGSLSLPQVQKAVWHAKAYNDILMLGLVFMVAGMAFKLGVVPFHMWMPDVYQGAPTAVTLMVATAPKLGIFAVMVRVLVGGLLALADQWQLMLLFLAICSLILGNFAAIMQDNVKRMLAYSTIAQNGFMLLAFAVSYVSYTPENNYLLKEALSASMLYMFTYILSAMAGFGVLLILSQQGYECETLDDLKGLNQRYPVYSGIMALAMLSLAGVPMTVGFYGKFRIIQVLLSAQGGLYLGLALFAVLMSVVGAFYYIRIIKVMFFDAPTQEPLTVSLHGRRQAHGVLALNGFLIVALGILPAGLLRISQESTLNMLRNLIDMAQ